MRERKFYEKNNISPNVLHLQTSATTRSVSGLSPLPPAPHSVSWLTPVTSAMVSTRGLCVLTSPDVCVSVSCSGWRLRVWTVDKQSGRRESVDSMCGEDNRREYTVPSVYSRWEWLEDCNCIPQCDPYLFRILHIAVSSIHKEVLSYKVSWITSGPLKPDSLQFQVSVFTIFDVCLFYSVFAICLSGTLLPQMPKVVWKF